MSLVYKTPGCEDCMGKETIPWGQLDVYAKQTHLVKTALCSWCGNWFNQEVVLAYNPDEDHPIMTELGLPPRSPSKIPYTLLRYLEAPYGRDEGSSAGPPRKPGGLPAEVAPPSPPDI